MNAPKKLKARDAIPLETLLDDPAFRRNFNIEVQSASRDSNLIGALLTVTLDAAATGRKFHKGRKVGAVSPVRKRVAQILKNSPSATATEVWTAAARQPPKGYQFFENTLGRYIEGPEVGDNMGWSRFQNVVSEERKKVKTFG